MKRGTTIDPLQFRAWAQDGARDQVRRILDEFPELRAEFLPPPSGLVETPTPRAGRPPTAPRRKLTKAQRAKLSRKMREVWRKRRKLPLEATTSDAIHSLAKKHPKKARFTAEEIMREVHRLNRLTRRK